jgi:hypothetical protein
VEFYRVIAWLGWKPWLCNHNDSHWSVSQNSLGQCHFNRIERIGSLGFLSRCLVAQHRYLYTSVFGLGKKTSEWCFMLYEKHFEYSPNTLPSNFDLFSQNKVYRQATIYVFFYLIFRAIHCSLKMLGEMLETGSSWGRVALCYRNANKYHIK